MQNNPLQLFSTPWFWSAFGAWTVAQIVKMTIAFIRTRRWDFHFFVSTGGMPSAHSAMVCGLATSVGLTEGFGAAVTMLAGAFAAITMFDAAVVRRAAGHQAKILNQMRDEIFAHRRISEKRLMELLGHTRLEVFVGMLVGIACATAIVHYWPAIT
jgi:acid phosphatase family membrane protein YuiD